MPSVTERPGVAFKTVSAAVDQAAGIVWPYRDPDNCYVMRVNALENRHPVQVVNGIRERIPPKGLRRERMEFEFQ